MNKVFLFSIVLGVLVLTGLFVMAKSLGSGESTVNAQNIKTVILQVSIPCPGHASLIQNALYRLDGITNIEYTPITTFIVSYDLTKTNEQEILNLDVFKDYPAKKVS
jgi:hypothetical protein